MFSKLMKIGFYNIIKKQSSITPINLRFFSSNIENFEKAKENLNKLKNDPGSEQKLKLYGLFKQATEGKCTKPKPGVINFVDRAKWEAWSTLNDMDKNEAMKTYISIVDSLLKEQGSVEEKSSGNFDKSSVDGIDIRNENGILTMTLNRPDKKNALTWEMYNHWADTLKKADQDQSVKIVVVTGSGDYFCSGNDLANFTKFGPNETPQMMAQKGNKVLQNFVGSFIDFSKPLIGLINGPAIGITVTTLGLYDAVFASDKATFVTPFTNLGQTAEGCSSFTFPQIFGPIKANQMLMFNRKFSATEAHELISKIIPHQSFPSESKKLVEEIASLPPMSMKYSKELVRGPLRETLHKVNEAECDRLMERWLSDECVKAITNFLSRKK